MALAIEAKRQIFTNNQRHKTDTGSPEVQIALLSTRISMLTEHFKTHKKDHGSRKGLLTLVAKRRRLLTYLRDSDPECYKAVLQRLGIRK
jgi:small subunit ribosomal protein S15